MKNNDFQKILILILISILSYWGITNIGNIISFIGNIFSIISPFIIGACLAFILNIPMSYFERKINEVRKKKNDKKWVRIISLIFAFIIIIFVLTIIVTLIVPELIDVINLLIKNIPMYFNNFNKFISNSNMKELALWFENQNITVYSIKSGLMTQLPDLLTTSITLVSGIINGITTFLIAIVFAIYILIDKEKLQKQSEKIIKAYLNKEKATKAFEFFKVINHTFKSFFTVQCLEATILGLLTMVGMFIFNLPYAVPIGVLIGVTALIPIVGAFIGLIIGAILILSISPIKMITFILFILILQQIEGNLIYPKVVGKSVGLPGMWVLFAVTVGGSIGGIVGMLLGVPVASIIYTLLKNKVNERLNIVKNKNDTIL